MDKKENAEIALLELYDELYSQGLKAKAFHVSSMSRTISRWRNEK